jgi:hypothetical protein
MRLFSGKRKLKISKNPFFIPKTAISVLQISQTITARNFLFLARP